MDTQICIFIPIVNPQEYICIHPCAHTYTHKYGHHLSVFNHQISHSSCAITFTLRLRNLEKYHGGARGVMVIVVGNGHGDTSSNPGQDWVHFT